MPRIFQPVVIDGKKILRLRELTRMTQTELADWLGVNEKTVRRWEKSRAKLRPYSRVLAKLEKLAARRDVRRPRGPRKIKFDLEAVQAPGYVED